MVYLYWWCHENYPSSEQERIWLSIFGSLWWWQWPKSGPWLVTIQVPKSLGTCLRFFFCPCLLSGIKECLAHQLCLWAILSLRHCTLPCSELQAFWHLEFEGFQTWSSWFWPVCTLWLPALRMGSNGCQPCGESRKEISSISLPQMYDFGMVMLLCWGHIVARTKVFLGWYQGFCIRTWLRGVCVSSPEEAFMVGRMSWQAVWDGVTYFSKCKVWKSYAVLSPRTMIGSVTPNMMAVHRAVSKIKHNLVLFP